MKVYQQREVIDDNRLPKLAIVGLWLISLDGVFMGGLLLQALGAGELSNIEQVIVFLIAFAVIPLHEVAHAILLKLYSGKAKFGVEWKWKYGGIFFYVSSYGYKFTRNQLLYTLIIPQFMTIILLGLAIILPRDLILANILVWASIINVCGGAIDYRYMSQLLCYPKSVYVEGQKDKTIIYDEVTA